MGSGKPCSPSGSTAHSSVFPSAQDQVLTVIAPYLVFGWSYFATVGLVEHSRSFSSVAI